MQMGEQCDAALDRQAIAERSYFRKEAGGSHLVLDVTEAEAAALEAVLERFASAGEIQYGTAQAEATTVTCLVGDLTVDQHIHFVDGSALGFWRASVRLKAQRSDDQSLCATIE